MVRDKFPVIVLRHRSSLHVFVIFISVPCRANTPIATIIILRFVEFLFYFTTCIVQGSPFWSFSVSAYALWLYMVVLFCFWEYICMLCYASLFPSPASAFSPVSAYDWFIDFPPYPRCSATQSLCYFPQTIFSPRLIIIIIIKCLFQTHIYHKYII